MKNKKINSLKDYLNSQKVGCHLLENIFALTDCLVGLVVASATAGQGVLGAIPGSDKVIRVSIRDFSVTVTERDLCPVDGKRLAPITWEIKNITGEMWVYY